jgi:hypothetical protein
VGEATADGELDAWGGDSDGRGGSVQAARTARGIAAPIWRARRREIGVSNDPIVTP